MSQIISMRSRGTYNLEVDVQGHLVDSPENLERLRALFRDERIIEGRWGPGDPGDFDHGSWHILCHLAAGGAFLHTARGPAWLAIGWDGERALYSATASIRTGDGVGHIPLASREKFALLAGTSPVLFLEGTSQGHITARGVQDPPEAFNGCPRQEYDHDITDLRDGGTVWEHWCTTRDIRSSSSIGTSVLGAYLSLVSVLGGRFAAALARGRREHEHPRQLVALVRAGVLTREEALWDTTPLRIPAAAQALFYQARPADSLKACERLDLREKEPLRYFMFERQIHHWSPADAVARDLEGM